MKIIVDADACPVKDIIEHIAREYQIQTILVANLNHMITSDYARIIRVDWASQSADIAIINLAAKGDLLVTQDYGLAAIMLAKGCYVLDHAGKEYTQDNIDFLLMRRYLNQKARQAGQRISGPARRQSRDNQRFDEYFRKVIERQIIIPAAQKPIAD
ncbi:MAG: YaiI/YqxD family protein [Syntrophomonadaceae bacterium]|nr:YaiI/YqxD family protein [Syntrophomonadaceae bacterium]